MHRQTKKKQITTNLLTKKNYSIMKTKKTIIADIDVKTGVETTEFYNAVYKTPKGEKY